MKTYNKSLFAVAVMAGATAYNASIAFAEAPPLAHTLTTERPVYLADDTQADDPIRFVMTFVNPGPLDVYASKTFLSQLWHTRLTLHDPDGGVHRADDQVEDSQVLPEPGKGKRCLDASGERVFCDPLDILPFDTSETPALAFDLVITVPEAPADAREYFSVLQWDNGPPVSAVKTGVWRVESNVPLRTYNGPDPELERFGVQYARDIDANVVFDGNLTDNAQFTIIGDYDGDGYPYPAVPDGWDPDFATVDCDDRNGDVSPGAEEVPGDGIDNDCDPVTPDVVEEPMGAVELTANLHIVGNKNTYPDAGKSLLGGLPFKVVEKTNPCFADFGLRFNHWQDRGTVYNTCLSPYSGITDAVTGAATVALTAGNEYVIVARYVYDEDSEPQKVTYLGVPTGHIEEDVTTTKYLQALLRADGSLVAGRYNERNGSLLHIIEPEYIEWDSTEETYPIVFDSIGDWTVTTAVAPPEGFVTDHEFLATEVNSELDAVQFTITDIGSDWVSTEIEYEVKHKDKTEKIRSKIGMKLSKKLAKEKKLPWCGQECPDESSVLSKTVTKDLKKKSKSKK